MKVSSYTSPKTYGHKLTQGIDEGIRYVQEKVDGSQFSFSKEGGVVYYRSRGQQIYTGSVQKLFVPAVKYIESIADKLLEGVTYRGEAVCSKRHNTLVYERAASGGVVLFDIEERGVEGENFGKFKDQKTVQEEAERLGLDYAPIYRVLEPGVRYTKAMFEEDLQRSSVLGGTIEGVVIKNYDRFFPDGKLMAAKVVTESFKEKHSKRTGCFSTNQASILDRLVDALKTEARWNKAVQHLREEGRLTGTPKDIGSLMREVNSDLEREEREWVKDHLYAAYRKDLLRRCTRGLAEWYKEQLGLGVR